jgi:hypothetical protein
MSGPWSTWTKNFDALGYDLEVRSRGFTATCRVKPSLAIHCHERPHPKLLWQAYQMAAAGAPQSLSATNPSARPDAPHPQAAPDRE